MTVLEEIQEKVKDLDTFAEWYEENCLNDYDPSVMWFDKNYCSKCKPVIKNGLEYTYCEVNHKCPFFPDMDEEPDCSQIVRLWLQSGG